MRELRYRGVLDMCDSWVLFRRVMCRLLISICVLLFAYVVAINTGVAADGNRLAYLDEMNPYYPSRTFPKLITPQWVGEEGIEAVVVLAIDDMRGSEKWEAFLRPILDRLKQIDGRAPVSIMTCTVDPKDPHLQQWLKEGLSIEVHTIDHPCPLLAKGDFAAAKSTYDRCVDLIASIPGNKPVAFRMPCCDSRNTNSPRFYAEIFNKTTEHGTFLKISSSVFNVLTPNDPDLPRELVLDKDGREKFRKYLPFPSFVNTIDDYPYPYVIGGLCWEFPCVTPSDWSAQNLNQPNNPKTVEDLQAALDAIVIKKGVFNLVFHPHGWIRAEQVNELIDHAVKKHGKKVKFLTFREAAERLEKNLLAGDSLRSTKGQDNGVRLLDLNADGYMDVVIGRAAHDDAPDSAKQLARVWSPAEQKWQDSDFPAAVVYHDAEGQSRPSGAAFGVVADRPTLLVKHQWAQAAVQFHEGAWAENSHLLEGLGLKNGQPLQTVAGGSATGVRLHDLDGDGSCELIAGGPGGREVFRWTKGERWNRLPFSLPEGIVDDRGRDAGLRFIDVDEDGHLDVLFSNDDHYSLHLFEDMEKGWSREAISGRRDEPPKAGRGIPPIVSGGTNTGAWVHSRHIWWQNESTDRLPDLVDRRSFNELLATVEPRAKSRDASLRSIRVRPGFQIEEVAAEPLTMDPVAFAWGGDGRLWVVEMADYPLGEDGHYKPGGRVRWLADTNGDGRYDRSQLFLEGLSIPTGVMPWRNGILITAAPDLIYAEDRDGDGRADHREVLYTGFAEGNPQHRVNGLRWGLDNWIHIANGESGGRVRSIKTGKTVNMNGRDLRVRPDTGDLEATAGETQFGREHDDWGNWFGNNNSNPLYHFALDEHYLRRNPHVPTPDGVVHVPSVPGYAPVFPLSRTLPRFNDHHTANRITSACSTIFYRDELFGSEFVGNSFVSEPVHNLIHREIVARRGVSFVSRRADDEQASEFFASSDNFCRPTMIRIGPDGALWIADMYRQTIEHPEWIPDDWEKQLDLRSGHDKGRIYRVYPVGLKPRDIPRMDQLDPAGLAALLESPSGTVRDTAQQRLIERNDASVAGALEKIVRTSGRATARLHALCTLDGLNLLTAARTQLLAACLADEHPAVRRHAIRLSEPMLSASPNLLSACLRLAGDSDPQVRQQLAYSLGACHDAESADALAKLLIDNANERLIAAAAISSLHKDNTAAVVDALHRSHLAPRDVSSQRSHLAPRDDSSRGAIGQQSPLPDNVLQAVIQTAVGLNPKQGWRPVAGLLTAAAREGEAPTEPPRYATWQLRAAGDLIAALESRGAKIANLLADANDSAEARALSALLDAAPGLAGNASQPLETRLAAIRLLGFAGNANKDSATLETLTSPDRPLAIQSAAIPVALRQNTGNIVDRLIGDWGRYSPQVRSQILDAMLARSASAARLLDAIEQGDVQPVDLSTPQRDRLLNQRPPELRDRAERLLAHSLDRNRQNVIDRFSQLAHSAGRLPGDAARGLAVFEKRCATCHRWGDLGHDVGPDLATLTDRLPGTMLVAIFDPNRAVEARYLSYTAVTQQGLSHTGILAQESDSSVTLVKPDGKRESLLRSELVELSSSGKSLMPEGLENELSPQDVADVLTMLAGPPK
jgi:putative membrane-bound dehydrogenase-like protein